MQVHLAPLELKLWAEAMAKGQWFVTRDLLKNASGLMAWRTLFVYC